MTTDMRGGMTSGRGLKTETYQRIDLVIDDHSAGWSKARVYQPLTLVHESGWSLINAAERTLNRDRPDLQCLKTTRHALHHFEDSRTPASAHIKQSLPYQLAPKVQEVRHRSAGLAQCDKVAPLRTSRMKRHCSGVDSMTDE